VYNYIGIIVSFLMNRRIHKPLVMGKANLMSSNARYMFFIFINIYTSAAKKFM